MHLGVIQIFIFHSVWFLVQLSCLLTCLQVQAADKNEINTESEFPSVLIANAAPVVVDCVSPPNHEGCDPGGQTLDPWSPAEICLGIIRPVKSLCMPERAHVELYRVVCSYSQPRGNNFTSRCGGHVDWHKGGKKKHLYTFTISTSK